MNGAKHLHAPNSENQKYVDSVDDFIRMLTQTSTMRVQKYFTRTISLDRSGSINYISKFAKIFNFLLNCALGPSRLFSARRRLQRASSASSAEIRILFADAKHLTIQHG
jgi:hypothetical protein